MITSRSFVIRHAPFSGSRFIRQVLAAHAPEEWGVTCHPTHPQAPNVVEAGAELPALLPVRHPLEWYVSWYCGQRRGVLRDDLFARASDHGALGFAETMENLFGRRAVQQSGMGPYTRAMRDAGASAGVRPIRAESVRSDLVDLLGEFESVGEPFVQSLMNAAELDRERHPGWSRFHTDRTRSLIRQFDGSMMKELGYEWPDEVSSAALATQLRPGALRPVQGVSLPRSGHSALFSCLFHYFREDLVFCDPEITNHCGCGHVPCIEPSNNLAKNHDFGLLRGYRGLPVRDDLRYLIQYRSPVRAIVSNYKLHIKHPTVPDSPEEWDSFREIQIHYWKDFMEKWVMGTAARRETALLCSYHDLVMQTPETLGRVIEFMTGRSAC
ncbi:MAG: hypothetical protein AB8H79_23785, partial [Myxococcota bacterium]